MDFTRFEIRRDKSLCLDKLDNHLSSWKSDKSDSLRQPVGVAVSLSKWLPCAEPWIEIVEIRRLQPRETGNRKPQFMPVFGIG